MASGMWTSATGATVQSQNLDIIANNLANSDTAAFKKDLPTFKEYLATVERPRTPQDIPRGQFKDKDFYPLDGRDQSYVVMDGTHVSHRQGHLRVTQGMLDVAMDGPGFLEVSTPQGIRYTREGSLKMAADGRLVTKEGYPVLAGKEAGLGVLPNATNQPLATPGGKPTQAEIAARYINLSDIGTQVTINQEGSLFADGDELAKLSLVEFKNLGVLRKVGGQLFESTDPANRTPATQTTVRQGVLETSNVNPIEEMTNMIRANRLFEEDLKAMKTYGDLMGKEANEVGKL